ncbi:MAG: hypothetical protein ACR2L1_00660, partial [Pyrinomonadaceae bacterium]
MKLTRSFLAVGISFSLVLFSFLCISIQSVNAQDSKVALQRGYRTGYSDGYMSGYRDSIENGARGYDRHNEYGKADRAYSKDYGALEDYRDGYQQGFEKGYDAGFEKRSFDAALPIEIRRRGIISPRPTAETTDRQTSAKQTATAEVKTPIIEENREEIQTT